MASLSRRKTKNIALLTVFVLCFLLGILVGYFTSPRSSNVTSGSSCDSKIDVEARQAEQKKKLDFHNNFYRDLSPEEIGKNLKYFSKHPHIGGTPRSKQLADEIERRWREYGFDKVEQPKYNILLPHVSPNISNKVQILLENNTVEREFSGKEKPADPSEDDPDMIPPLLGYAKPGVANGTLLYVNYGRTEDFNVLKKNLSISDCKGKLVIMRYGRIYRGDKITNAQLCGAVGAILYNDPADYAPYGPNETYPNGVWLPKTGVQRGGTLDGNGDPLTPGLPSVDGIFRIPQEKAKLPQIPATPMPYGEAIKILEIMEGSDVPGSWKGKLPIPYKLGNGGLKGNKTIRIEVNVPNKRQDIYNVIGTIYGKEEPDRWVLIGNHRDAWGFGAADPASGTSIMMEISRGLQYLLRSGWRPRRTIKFCSWGAEEPGLMGSTEWVEDYEQLLSKKAITYLNVDIGVGGNYTLRIGGSPLLETITIDEMKKVKDPHVKEDGQRKTVYERILETRHRIPYPLYGKIAAWSDYAPFYQFVGVPSLDLSYDYFVFYPVYHTVHDTYNWLHGFMDPNFAYHLTTASVLARLLMNAADNFLLPFDVLKYEKALRDSLQTLRDRYGDEMKENNVTLGFIEKAIERFAEEAERFMTEKESAIDNKTDIELRNFNDRMVNVEKAFIYPLGLPNQPYTRHVVFAPSFNNRYGTTSFPGVSDLMFLPNKAAKDWDMIKQQVSIVFKSISQATDTLLSDTK